MYICLDVYIHMYIYIYTYIHTDLYTYIYRLYCSVLMYRVGRSGGLYCVESVLEGGQRHQTTTHQTRHLHTGTEGKQRGRVSGIGVCMLCI
jgi:hypothetical protein